MDRSNPCTWQKPSNTSLAVASGEHYDRPIYPVIQRPGDAVKSFRLNIGSTSRDVRLGALTASWALPVRSDLAHLDRIEPIHLAEAIQYQPRGHHFRSSDGEDDAV
jgi:hypothetical protein